jgi:hypothetical protein
MVPLWTGDRSVLVAPGFLRMGFARAQAGGAMSTVDDGQMVVIDLVTPGFVAMDFARAQAGGAVSTGDV